MPTRNLEKNQNATAKRLERNENQAVKSMGLDYILAMDLIRAELQKAEERYGSLDNETMSKFYRRERLTKKILEILNPTLRKVNRKIKRLVDINYKQSYFRNAWAVDQNLGVELKWKLKK